MIKLHQNSEIIAAIDIFWIKGVSFNEMSPMLAMMYE